MILRPLLPALGTLVLAANVALVAQAPAMTREAVLAAIDHAASGLKSLAANAKTDDYTAMVQDDTQASGTLAFKKTKSGPMYVLDLSKPAASAKELVYRDRTAYIYTPASHQVQVYALGDKQELLNQFLLLGLGSTASELTNAYKVALDGAETVNGFTTEKLTLTPLDAGVAAKISKVDLWYDTRTWIAVEMQLWEGVSGDYHRLQYTNLKPNASFDDKVFDTAFDGAKKIMPHP